MVVRCWYTNSQIKEPVSALVEILAIQKEKLMNVCYLVMVTHVPHHGPQVIMANVPHYGP